MRSERERMGEHILVFSRHVWSVTNRKMYSKAGIAIRKAIFNIIITIFLLFESVSPEMTRLFLSSSAFYAVSLTYVCCSVLYETKQRNKELQSV